jgi:hypothetical protein
VSAGSFFTTNSRHLASIGIRHADGGIRARPGAYHDLLDFVRIHVEARNQDHVFLAVDDTDEALLVHHTDVAGGEETIGAQHFGGLVGAIPVPFHDLRPADADLAGLPARHFLAGVIAQDDLRRGHRQADRAVVLGEIERIHRRARTGFGEAVAFEQSAAGDVSNVRRRPSEQPFRRRRTAAAEKSGFQSKVVEKALNRVFTPVMMLYDALRAP